MSCQQGELYVAEEQALRLIRPPRLTVKEAQRLVDAWRELDWFERNFPRVAHVQVVRRRSNGRGSCGGLIPPNGVEVPSYAERLEEPHLAVVEMAPVHMNTLYLIHEVCHPLCESRYGNGAHHPAFARHYLELTHIALGSEAYKHLYDAFERAGIDHEGWS